MHKIIHLAMQKLTFDVFFFESFIVMTLSCFLNRDKHQSQQTENFSSQLIQFFNR